MRQGSRRDCFNCRRSTHRDEMIGALCPWCYDMINLRRRAELAWTAIQNVWGELRSHCEEAAITMDGALAQRHGVYDVP